MRSTRPGEWGVTLVAARLMLVTHAPTAATRIGAFPGDDAVSAEDLPSPVTMRSTQVLVGPERRCRQTAQALGWSGAVEPRLADLDTGSWRGRTLDSLLADSAEALSCWLADPSVAPHGGESLTELIFRIGTTLADRAWPDGRSVLVVSPLVVRAALVHLLAAPASLIFAFDVGPLTAVTVSGHGGRWVLQAILPWRRWQSGGA
jgi:broad specificity phosphatase PhoE